MNAVRLEILGPFELIRAGRSVAVPVGAQRLLALLAVRSEGIHRRAAAEQLWPECPPCRAAANLRSALCQSRKLGPRTVVVCDGHRLALSPSVSVDHGEVCAAARQLLEGGVRTAPSDLDRLVEDLGRPLLPGWDDEWLMIERERWDQMRLYALEGLAQHFLALDRYLAAHQAALAATVVDPFRETAHRIAIEVHAAEGNVACAVKHYLEYRRLLQQELRVSPSPRMTELIRELTTA
ncbi:SARP family transcriptional regulator [Streptomyces cinnabarinus]|uniref:SARP family transcriptional regulator n=1 Tax=Streptomyces cinnabarinus TaxID=67287 RepID=A0ABY7K9Q6_9ACTN|nr:BTAD domain-containing putative transcriptional regulator [Streptomyces cinnabarinus]WAZ19641.1 SARP family transcriptional regulator [Streptomyces cinnabarinus]